MKPADVLKKNIPPNILLYGLAGAGKTALATQLSHGYVFDFDDGMRTAATLKDKFFDVRQNIEFDTYTEDDPMKPVAWLQAMKKLHELIQLQTQGKLPYDAVVIDSLSGACKVATYNIMSKGSKGNDAKDPLAKLNVWDYSEAIANIERMLTMLRSLKVLTIVISHVEIEEEHPKMGETVTTAMFPRSISKPHATKALMTYFDEVLYADARVVGQGKIEYRIFGKSPNTIIKARTRSNIDMIVHNEIGLRGILKQMGYTY